MSSQIVMQRVEAGKTYACKLAKLSDVRRSTEGWQVVEVLVADGHDEGAEVGGGGCETYKAVINELGRLTRAPL